MYLLCSMHVLHCLRYSCIRLNQVLCLQCVFTLTTQASHQYTFERWRNKRLGRGSWCHLIPRLPQLFEGQSTQRAEPRRASWLAGEVSPELTGTNRTKGWEELHSWNFLTLWFWVLVFFLVMFQSKKPNKKSGHHFITLGPWPICQASLGLQGTYDKAIGKATPEVRIQTACMKKGHVFDGMDSIYVLQNMNNNVCVYIDIYIIHVCIYICYIYVHIEERIYVCSVLSRSAFNGFVFLRLRKQERLHRYSMTIFLFKNILR